VWSQKTARADRATGNSTGETDVKSVGLFKPLQDADDRDQSFPASRLPKWSVLSCDT